MKPETIQKLTSDVPELKELIAFLIEEAGKLNNLSNLNMDMPYDQVAIEVKARQRAYEKIGDILHPLLNVQPKIEGIKNEDFVV